MIKFFNITAATQNVNTTATQNANTIAEKIASKAMKICIIYMHYFSVVETVTSVSRLKKTEALINLQSMLASTLRID